jgi:hypothetical protein
MTYGCISDDMRKHIEKRIAESKTIRPVVLEVNYCQNDGCYPCDMDCECPIPDGLFTISIIIEGALDEEFDIISGGYEANVADWIVEKLNSENVGNYWVIVSDYWGDTVYSVESGV